MPLDPEKLTVTTKIQAESIISSQQTTPVSSPPPQDSDGWAEIRKNSTSMAVTPNLAGMSKEDKAAEMARRREGTGKFGSFLLGF